MRTVLVVDDDANLREGLRDLIELLYREHVERGELQVKAAGSGREAIELSARTTLDLVLMDINMPGLDGIETYYLMKETRGGVGVQTLFITGYGDAGTVRSRVDRAVSDGALGFLSKPVTAAQLTDVIGRRLFTTQTS